MAEVKITDLHDAILRGISKAFPSLVTVTAYDRIRGKMAVPAALLFLAEMERMDDVGTEQLCLECRFDLFLVLDALMDGVGQNVRQLAGDLALYIHGNRFGLEVSPAKVVGLAPTEFLPAMAQHVEWQISWTHEIYLGPSCWDGEGIIPTEVLYSIVPEIGPLHVDSYKKLGDIAHETPTE